MSLEKRMLHEKDGKWFINSSSVEVLQSCYRKGEYLFEHGLRSESSKAQAFGTLIHKVLARWYEMPSDLRNADTMTGIYEAEWKVANYTPEDDSPKTHKNGLATMLKYADVFKADDLQVVLDQAGKPMVEWSFEFELAPDIVYFGTVDMVVKDKNTDKIYVLDHKTTSALGVQFNNSWNPNHQITGYIWAISQAGFECDEALIQGIQVMKTKQEVCRVPTRRTQENFQDWKSTVVDAVLRYKSYREFGFFPHAGNHTCSGFSGCQFLDFCKASREVRKELIERKKSEIATALEIEANPEAFKNARDALAASALEQL